MNLHDEDSNGDCGGSAAVNVITDPSSEASTSSSNNNIIPTGIPMGLPNNLEWTDMIRFALYKINGPSQSQLLKPLTELQTVFADRIGDFIDQPIEMVKGLQEE
uniref:Uncharacterized protein n=1 Tax=Cannabis sativa TaxID=3483 RepID=A0A803QLP4_CANSA